MIKDHKITKIIDGQQTNRRSSLQISIINKILVSISWQSNMNYSLNLIYTISTYVFSSPLVFAKNFNAYVQSKQRLLLQNRIFYHSQVPRILIFKSDQRYLNRNNQRHEQYVLNQNICHRNFETELSQQTQYAAHQITLKENYIFKIKVVRIWKRCQCSFTQDSIMNLGVHLIRFFKFLRFGRKRKVHPDFDSSQSDNNAIENQNQLFWGSKQGPVKIIAENEKIIMLYLKQLKKYQKDKIIREGLKRALHQLLKTDILILFRFEESQYDIFFQKKDKKQSAIQMSSAEQYQSRFQSRNQISCLAQKKYTKLTKQNVKILIQKMRKEFVQFNGEDWIVKRDFQVWQKVRPQGLKSRSIKKIKDGYLNEYILDDYFLQQI